MKTPWRCQVEQTPHQEVYNGGGVVFKASLRHRKKSWGGQSMKTPWRCQVEQTPHREVYNGGGVVLKGRFYNQGVTHKV